MGWWGGVDWGGLGVWMIGCRPVGCGGGEGEVYG